MPKNVRDLVPLSPRPELPYEERIAALEQAFSGRIGFHALRLEDAEEVGLRADDTFPTASVIKVALCCAVLDLVARGEADLGERVQLPPPGRRVAGGGILKQLDVEAISLRDAIELTITLSDNVATNALLERCDAGRVNVYLESPEPLRHAHPWAGRLRAHHQRRSRRDRYLDAARADARCSQRSRAGRSSPPTSVRTCGRSSGGSTTRIRFLAGSAGTRMPSTTAASRC